MAPEARVVAAGLNNGAVRVLGLTKTVLETALDAGMSEHLGSDIPAQRRTRRRGVAVAPNGVGRVLCHQHRWKALHALGEALEHA